jgi:hypothetical protein
MASETDTNGLVLREALLDQHNLILLGGAALFSWALLSPLPLYAALGGEALWLLFALSSPRYRGWLRNRDRRQAQQHWITDIEVAAARLTENPSPRVRAVGGAVIDVARLAAQGDFEETLGPKGGRKLLSLIDAFTRVTSAHERLTQLVGNGPAAATEEIGRLTRAVAEEKDPNVRISLRQALSMTTRRLKQVEEVESARRALGIKMNTVDTLLAHVRSQVATGAAGEEVSLGLDDLLTAVRYNPQVESEASRALDSGRLSMIVEAVHGAAAEETEAIPRLRRGA